MIEPVIGHNDVIGKFLHSRTSGRFHHAWLFEGPRGVGKATAAMNLAAWVLGSSGIDSVGQFAVRDGEVVQHIVAGSHPDFRILRKTHHENGKPRQDIPVEDIRKLTSFFSLKPALGGYRVAVIDSLDELNPNGMNALLKTLEEPPKNCLLILIHHGQSGLLPTIRSRCQRLRFSSLDREVVETVLSVRHPDTVIPDTLIEVASGSPGLVHAYADIESQSLLSTLEELRDKAWPKVSPQLINRLLQEMIKSETHFNLAMHFIDHWFSKTALMQELPPQSSAAVAQTWQNIRRETGKSIALKLDLAETCAKCLGQIQNLAKRVSAYAV
jgi:DNA polymerase-3 subunit delta'